MPGGKVKVGEDIVNAMIRELREETSLRVKTMRHLLKRYVCVEEVPYELHIFEIRADGILKINEESVDYDWIDLLSFPFLDTMRFQKRLIVESWYFSQFS